MNLKPVRVTTETYCELARRAAKNKRSIEEELLILLNISHDGNGV